MRTFFLVIGIIGAVALLGYVPMFLLSLIAAIRDIIFSIRNKKRCSFIKYWQNIAASSVVILLTVSAIFAWHYLGEIETLHADIESKDADNQSAFEIAAEKNQTISDLESQVSNLTGENSRLLGKVSDLQERVSLMKSAHEFYSKRAMILPNDGSGVFHMYGCPLLDLSSYRIYDAPTVFKSGYDPCTYCLTSGYWIGNTNTHIYHVPTCGSLPNRNNRTYFTSPIDAEEHGYRPCELCGS